MYPIVTFKTLYAYILEAEAKKAAKPKPVSDVNTDTKSRPKAAAIDLEPKDANPIVPAEPEKSSTLEPETPAPERRRAAQSDTQRATANMHPTDDMRNTLSRMRNIEYDADLPDYPARPNEPANDIEVRVDTNNLPTVAGQALNAGGVQNPEWHQVANLPGNMSRAIRQLGRSLFRSMTTTPTDDIYMIANLGGQGPNSTREVNAVAGWLRTHGEDLGAGDIDFDRIMPGYGADIHQYVANGIRWLVVQDQGGEYIYSWPENTSVQLTNQPRLLR